MAQEPFPDEGLKDEAGGLLEIYSYAICSLVIGLGILVFVLLLKPNWPTAVLMALLLNALMFIPMVILQGSGWMMTLRTLLTGIIWSIGVLLLWFYDPSPAKRLLPLMVVLVLVLLTLLLIARIVERRHTPRGRSGSWGVGLIFLPLIGSLLVMWGMEFSWIPLSLGLLFYVSGVLFLLFLFGGLFFLGGYLLPFPPADARTGRAGWAHRFQNHRVAGWTLLGYLMGWHYPFWVMTREPREEDKLEERGEGDALAMYALGRGIIITDCDHAVVIHDGVTFRGARGPGLVLTAFAERPLHTLDLRPQLRAFEVEGLTRDGIQIKVRASVSFQIDRGEQRPRLGDPFPYRTSAAFLAVRAQMQELPGGPEPSQHSWDELPSLFGTRILQDILARYNFDDLYRYDPDQEPPRVRIAREYRERLKAELEPFGIQLIGGGISNLLPVKEEVLKERVRNWRTEWMYRILAKQAEGQRERLWRIEQARAEAQAQLIMALGDQLAELERSDTPATPERIVRHFLGVLEDMAQQPMLRRFLPRETHEGLRHLGADAQGKEAAS